MKYTRQGVRTFYRIDEKTGEVVRVVNKELVSSIFAGVSQIVEVDAEDQTKDITEQEFNEQLSIALSRIDSGLAINKTTL